MANFPSKSNSALTQDFSPSDYSNEPMVETASAKSEGGYEHRRRRFTRTPRREISVGFKGLKNADFQIVEDFYDAHLEDTEFTFYDPIKDTSYTCRFDEWKPKYVGIGTTLLWDIQIKMSEV